MNTADKCRPNIAIVTRLHTLGGKIVGKCYLVELICQKVDAEEAAKRDFNSFFLNADRCLERFLRAAYMKT